MLSVVPQVLPPESSSLQISPWPQSVADSHWHEPGQTDSAQRRGAFSTHWAGMGACFLCVDVFEHIHVTGAIATHASHCQPGTLARQRMAGV